MVEVLHAIPAARGLGAAGRVEVVARARGGYGAMHAHAASRNALVAHAIAVVVHEVTDLGRRRAARRADRGAVTRAGAAAARGARARGAAALAPVRRARVAVGAPSLARSDEAAPAYAGGRRTCGGAGAIAGAAVREVAAGVDAHGAAACAAHRASASVGRSSSVARGRRVGRRACVARRASVACASVGHCSVARLARVAPHAAVEAASLTRGPRRATDHRCAGRQDKKRCDPRHGVIIGGDPAHGKRDALPGAARGVTSAP